MPSGVAARRYAQAVFELGDAAGTLERWERDLSRVVDALDDPAIAAFFASPKSPAARKREIVAQILGPSGEPLVANLVGLLIERGRLAMLPLLYADFHELLLARQGIAVGDITTAIPLGPDELAAVRSRLKALVGKEVELRPHVDPEIIGGIIVRIGDSLIDGSVTSQLRRLRERLVSAH